MPGIGTAVRAVRELGLKPVRLYAGYQMQLRSGWVRMRTPVCSWEQAEAGYHRNLAKTSLQRPLGLFDLRRAELDGLQEFLKRHRTEVVKPAEEILAGRFSFFGQEEPLDTGFPPEWNLQPAFDSYPEKAVPADLHWTRTSTSRLTDVKYLWELSRFGWAYTLGRAYAASGEMRYWEAFWELFESWRQANLPNAGPHWISGQEVALRLLAVMFTRDVFAPQLEAQPERAHILDAFLAVHAARLPHTLLYARAQANNHLVSDALGLYAAGLSLRTHRAASRWRSLGRRWLVRALDEQVFEDGGYVQHSHTYARLALQEGLLGAVLAELHGEPLPERTLETLRRMARLLASMMDAETGCVPNFGPNDGALVLPLACQPIVDFRPVIQAAFRLLDGRSACEPRAWDELALWLGAGDAGTGEGYHKAGGKAAGVEGSPGIDPEPDAMETGREAVSLGSASFPQAGLYLINGGKSRAVLRCAHFTNRPGHSDQLHLDLWWRGQALAVDAGTYLYNAPQPWENSLVGADVHNSLTINGHDPMRRVSRFLMLDWAQGRLFDRRASADGRFEFLTAEHDGYRKAGLKHRRTVLRIDGERWAVIDDVLPFDPSAGPARSCEVRVSWLLPDLPVHAVSGRKAVTIPDGLLDRRNPLDGSFIGDLSKQSNQSNDVPVNQDKAVPENGISFSDIELQIGTPHGPALLQVYCDRDGSEGIARLLQFSHYRCGELVDGDELEGAHPGWGWISPTYGEKRPAHLVVASCRQAAPMRLVSFWTLGEDMPPGLELDLRPSCEPGSVLKSVRCGDGAWSPDPGNSECDR